MIKANVGGSRTHVHFAFIGGTDQTRTDTPAYADEWISNPLQYLLCLLFRVRVHFCSAPKELHSLQSCELRLTLIVTQYVSPVTS